jgi:hypothetical protein
VLCALLVWLYALENKELNGLPHLVLFNWAFLTLQLLLVSIYFSLKSKRWTVVTGDLLGWGDILFLLCPAVYLSTADFLAFYILSLAVIVVLVSLWQILPGKKITTIPLAGLQAILFGGLLCAEWWLNAFKFMDGRWLNLIAR